MREFLAESDGLVDNDGSAVVWPAAEIDRRNREIRSNEGFRELHKPFNDRLFFGEDGGGDQFAFAIHADGAIHSDDICRWEPEDDARPLFAARLQQSLERRLADDEDDDEG